MNKKILLWIIGLVLLSSLTYATLDESVYRSSYSTSFASANSRAPLVEPNWNLTLINITKSSSDGATRGRIITYPGESVLDYSNEESVLLSLMGNGMLFLAVIVGLACFLVYSLKKK